jgi:hypothetical protein
MVDERGISFKDFAIVACGTLRFELNHIRKSWFLNSRRILYTKPGRHEAPRELESQLANRIAYAKKHSDKIIVVYGGKFCYINANNPSRTIEQIIREQGPGVSKIEATHCVDMLVSVEERRGISKGEKVLWLTPGWIVYRDYVFEDWDKGKANENFPQYTGGAILLDAVGFWEEYSERHPERILDFSDWMGIPIQPYKVSLERLKRLLSECVQKECW